MEKQWGERIVYRGKIMSSSREAENCLAEQGTRGTVWCYQSWRNRAMVYEAEKMGGVGSDGRRPQKTDCSP